MFTWEQREFGELAEYKKGPFGSALTKGMFVEKSNESVKVYEQQNAINKNENLERYFIPKDYANKMKGFQVIGGDIIVSCAGTIGEIYELPIDSPVGIINQALMRIRINEEIIEKKLFAYVFSNMIDEFSRTHSNGSAIKNIPPFADLKPFKVLLPKMEEQKQLVKMLTTSDNLITCHQREYVYLFNTINHNTAIKSCGFNLTWEQRKLGDEFVKVNERNNGTYGKEHWISVAQMYFQNPEKVQSNNILTRTYVMKYGDMAFEGHSNKEFEYGRFVVNDIGNGVISELFPIYRHILPYDNYYWKYAIQRESVMRPIYASSITSSGASANKLTEEHFLKNHVLVPKLKEQAQIGTFFKTLDNLITCHQRKPKKFRRNNNANRNERYRLIL